MFDGASSFNNNISSWDVSSVTYMQAMFRYASSFGTELCNWSHLNPSVDVSNMFDGSNCSIERCFKCPTGSPTANPTGSKTSKPTAKPTDDPTGSPTRSLTANPTGSKTSKPTAKPTDDPTGSPRDRSFVNKLILKKIQSLQSANDDLEEAVVNLQAKHAGLEAQINNIQSAID